MSRTGSPRAPLPREPQLVAVDGITHGGEGVARVRGKAVFVPGALPGEVVLLQVTDDRTRWARAALLEVVEPSPGRITPPCPFVPECGGCDLQHATPATQRALKTRVVREQLQRLGGVADPPVLACRAVGPDVGYRAQARLHAAPDGRLGFHRAGSNEVVPVDHCLVLAPGAQQLREQIGDATGASEVRLRRFTDDSRGAAVLTPGPGPLELPGGDVDLLLTQPDGSAVAMRGDGDLEVEVDGLRFQVPALSFFQPGVAAATALLREVVAAAGPIDGALTWDLYAGVGLLSLGLARAGAEVVAVEGDAAAVAAARRNAALNGLPLDARHHAVGPMLREAARGAANAPLGGASSPPAGSASTSPGGPSSTPGSPASSSRGGASSPPAGERPPAPLRPLDPPDVVVLDPPRSGAGNQAIDDLCVLAPAAIVYVACDVAALARDTRRLRTNGYRLRRAAPLDLFPMTHHVEVVATFTP